MKKRACQAVLVLILLVLLLNCGGGGGSTGGGGTQPPPPPLPPTFKITTTSIPPTVAGTAISFQLKAENGTEPLKWSAYPWMPPNLSLSSSGLIIGTPTSSWCSPITINVTDSSTPQKSASANVQYSVAAMYNGIRQGQVGEHYSWGFQFQCATEPITWSLVAGTVPPGLKMNPFQPGSMQLDFSGMPEEPGAWDVTVQGKDSLNRTLPATGTIKILPPVLKIVSADQIRPGVVNESFDFPISARGGTSPYQFSISAGALPAGLALSAATGGISGTPSAAGFSQFTVRVTDKTTPMFRDEKAYTLLVTALPLPARNNTLADATPIFPGTYEVSLSPFTDNNGDVAPDEDYYVVTANGGEIYHVAIASVRSASLFADVADPVLEILDSTGKRMMTCNDPLADNPPAGAPFAKGAGDFTDACMNVQAQWTDPSQLDIKLPDTSAVSFYIHVFDFKGRARPDARYSLYVGKR